ncbi:MAG TPA: MFS transporter [Phycisphaerae bacterium]|nr:MFS transporter [Phycisphaerae bacterium]HRR86242.1 MFS transporter [Phycisphaerae bacterium]
MIISIWRRFFAPAPHIPRLPDDQVRRVYPYYRWRVMEATYIGYATYYLVRNNINVVTKDMETALGYDDSMLGSLLAINAIAYGLGKFVMGALSDRSNPRVFMGVGLLLTAFCNFAFGSVASYPVHLFLWATNGLFQGMGWPPCGRSMGHWFSEKERGLTFSIWNTAHNVGGGVAGVIAGYALHYCGGWQFAFFIPGVLATIGGLYVLFRLCDTPQSVGLPPIEEYRQDYPNGARPGLDAERELTTRELLVDMVFTNKYIWILAAANFFAYVTRYSMLDWGPKYLREIKGATEIGGGVGTMFLEFGGIPSTIILGWVSDLLKGRRGMVAVLCLAPIIVAFTVIMFTPAGYLWLDMAMLTLIGFLIYPVINLIVIQALDLTSKKAIGTAAGFIGLMGYFGKATQAKGFGWILYHLKPVYGQETAWMAVMAAILLCTAIGVVLLSFTWRLKPRA